MTRPRWFVALAVAPCNHRQEAHLKGPRGTQPEDEDAAEAGLDEAPAVANVEKIFLMAL